MARGKSPADRPSRTPRFDWTVLVMYGGFALVPVLVLVGAGAGPHPIAMISFSVLWQIAELGAVAFAARAAWHRALDGRTRRAWRLIAASMVVFAASNVAHGFQPLGQDFPSAADVLRLSFVPVMLVGLVLLPLRSQSRQDRRKVWLDTGSVVTSAAMLLWFLEVQPALAGGRLSGATLAAALAYPAGDLALIFVAVLVLLRGAASSVRRPMTLLAAGILLLALGDLYLGYSAARATTFHGQPWQFICWMVGTLFFCVAGYEQCRQASGHRIRYQEKVMQPVARLPYLAIALGYALLLYATARSLTPSINGLVVGAIALTALVVGRQILAQQETHHFAVTDALTGLVNRRRLQDSLALALSRSVRSGQQVAVMLLDMNGFKQVNDTLGHEAGDHLLIAFGRLLRRNVLGADVVGRLGGDEFAVVLHNIGSPANALAVADRIIADMRDPVMIGDTPLQPSASIGIAIAGPGELGPDELLRRADRAMYRAKESKAAGAGYQLYCEEQAPTLEESATGS